MRRFFVSLPQNMRRFLINNAAREKIRQAPLAIVVCGCLAKTLIPLNTLIIGYPKNLAEAKDKWKEENISYNKWMEKNS